MTNPQHPAQDLQRAAALLQRGDLASARRLVEPLKRSHPELYELLRDYYLLETA